MLTYAAARTAAERILHHFAEHPMPSAGLVPDADALATLIDTAFWTSLRRDEIYTPRISFAYVAPGQASTALHFTSPFRLTPRDLIKLSAAAERPGIHLGVSPNGNGMLVWGLVRQLPPLTLVIEIVIPGLVVVKRSPPADTGKFLNVAVLQGEEIKIIDADLAIGPNSPELLASLLRLEDQFATGGAVNVLLQLAVSMRAHGRGGLLLVVGAGSETWKESMLHPINYEASPPYRGLAKLMEKDEAGRASRSWEDALARSVDGIAGLTAVDGATVIATDYAMLAFGAKIVRRRGSPVVARVIVSEPIEGSTPAAMEPAQLGGTRHLAAAQFVHDQHDSIALVASQDGRFTAFGWSPADNEVWAHRIDALLL